MLAFNTFRTLGSNKSIPHRAAPETVDVDVLYHSTTTRNKLPPRYQYGMVADDGRQYEDNSLPEDPLPPPKKSPKLRERSPAFDRARNLPPPTNFDVERTYPTPRRSTPGIRSSAQESYVSTQAFLCENEEII